MRGWDGAASEVGSDSDLQGRARLFLFPTAKVASLTLEPPAERRNKKQPISSLESMSIMPTPYSFS